MRKLGQFLSAAHITEFNLAERAQLRPIFNVETLQSNVNKFYSCGSLALTSLRKIYYLLEYFLKESLIAAAGAPPVSYFKGSSSSFQNYSLFYKTRLVPC